MSSQHLNTSYHCSQPLLSCVCTQTPPPNKQGLDLAQHSGVNLCVGKVTPTAVEAVYFTSNRGGVASTAGTHEPVPGPSPHGATYCVPLRDGVHAISNGPLGAPWPKTERITQLTRGLLAQQSKPWYELEGAELDAFVDGLFRGVLWDTQGCTKDDDLPQTGMGDEIERLLSPICIKPTVIPLASPGVSPNQVYGTRTSTVMMFSAQQGAWTVYERSRTADAHAREAEKGGPITRSSHWHEVKLKVYVFP